MKKRELERICRGRLRFSGTQNFFTYWVKRIGSESEILIETWIAIVILIFLCWPEKQSAYDRHFPFGDLRSAIENEMDCAISCRRDWVGPAANGCGSEIATRCGSDGRRRVLHHVNGISSETWT